MKINYSFLKGSACVATLLAFVFLFSSAFAVRRDFYQIKIYRLKDAGQEARLNAFFKDAYLPALHRAGITKVGVFKYIGAPNVKDPVELYYYVLIPFKSSEQFFKLDQKLAADKAFAADGKDYIDAAYNNTPYSRIESVLLQGFTGSPVLKMPDLKGPMSERVYEIRSYEGPTEKLYLNKVEMFHKGDEIGIFKRLGFNAVFYGEVISGANMPNLMYMTTFENRAERDEHWKAFSADEQWKKVRVMPEYQNNVSKNDTRFFRPADYSDI
jgi:hypothetical protein